MKALNRWDTAALGLLCALWLLFFWRLLTPNPADRLTLQPGDFSGQFLAFSAYQYERFASGEIPLWNPYNNAGFPFIGDTQAAVFYPPRLLMMAAASATGGWGYRPLELEGVLHILMYSVGWYWLLRRLLTADTQGIAGALLGTVVASYGGFMAGYPILQLAILESACWLPFALTGLHAAITPTRTDWGALLWAGAALALAWLAGHPQTAWYATMLCVAWLAWRCYEQRRGWRSFALGLAVFGAMTGAAAAVALVPQAEYLLHTSRTGLGIDAKANGFPPRDIVQWVMPGVVSVFSPLYVGIPALALGFSAAWNLAPARFWAAVCAVALLLSFGGSTVLYELLYQLPIGLSFFRGQERAAWLFSAGGAVLAAYGTAHLLAQPPAVLRAVVRWLCAGLCVAAVVVLLASLAAPQLTQASSVLVFSAGISLALLALTLRPHRPLAAAAGILALAIFELFSTGMGAPGVYTTAPGDGHLLRIPPLVQQVQADDGVFRVDGFRGITDNYASAFQVMDIRGISPLFLNNAQRLIYQDYSHNPRAWEILAVRYVFSDREQFSTPTTVVGRGTDRDGSIFLHQLADPRPFAHLVTQVDVVDSDAFAYALLSDPAYRPRENVILQHAAPFTMPAAPDASAGAVITHYGPEHIRIAVRTPHPAVLTLAQVDYPGWRAALDTEEIPIYRAYGVTMAFFIPEGDHTLVLRYEPASLRLGAVLSAGSLLALAVASVWSAWRRTGRQA
jgi:hypothetical protein